MVQVTPKIDPALAQDLLQRVPRACIAFASDDRAWAQPILLKWHEDQYWIAIPQSAAQRPDTGQEVVLLVDEGIYYFDLRAIYIRGSVQPAQPVFSTSADYAWFILAPSRTIAWDYGTIHQVDDEH